MLSKSPLSTRPFGTTDMTVTTVGIGSSAMGEPGMVMSSAPDDGTSLATLRRALELGINWIDTAAAYGSGHAEEVVGRFLRSLDSAERPLVFTKCGLQHDPRDPIEGPIRRVGARDSIRGECEDSLRRLGVESLDLLQIHAPPDDGTPVEETWQTLLDLKREGKIRAAGVSNFDVALLERCEALGHVDSCQPHLSLIVRDHGADVVPWCAAHGTAVIVYSPMYAGLLSGTYTAARAAAMDSTDRRFGEADFQEPRLSRNLRLVEAVRAVAKRRDVAVEAVSVAWTLAWPGVTGAIVGARRPDQVDGWIDAGRLALDETELEELARAVEETGAGSGPARP